MAWSSFPKGSKEQMEQRLLREALQLYAPCREGVITLGDLAMEIVRAHPSMDLFAAMVFAGAFFHCLEMIGEGEEGVEVEMSMDMDGFRILEL